MENKSFKYDIFISYSTKSDYRLARDIERFIESFHDLKLPFKRDGKELRKLDVCRDGSEFILKAAPEMGKTDEKRDELWMTIQDHLEKSRYLLLLACPQSAESPWVRQEVDWFVKNRPQDIWIAVSEDSGTNPQSVFPPEILQLGLHKKLWFDFRAHRPAARGTSAAPKELEDELVRLTANLHSVAAGELSPIYVRDKLKREKRRARIKTLLAVVGLSLALATTIAWILAVQRKHEAERSAWEARRSLHLQLLEQSGRSSEAGYRERAMLETFKAEQAMAGEIGEPQLLRRAVQGSSLLWHESVPFEGLLSELLDAGDGRVIGLRDDAFCIWDRAGALTKVLPLDNLSTAGGSPSSIPLNFAVNPTGEWLVWARASGVETEYIFQNFDGKVLYVARPAIKGYPMKLAARSSGIGCAIIANDETGHLLDGPSGKELFSVDLNSALEQAGARPDRRMPWGVWDTGEQVIFAHPSLTTVVHDWSTAPEAKITHTEGPRMDQIQLAADRRTFYGLDRRELTEVYRWPVDQPGSVEKIEIPDSIAPHPQGLSNICGFDASRAVLFAGEGQYWLESSKFRRIEGSRGITWWVDNVTWDSGAADFLYTQVPLVHLADPQDPAEQGRVDMALNPALRKHPRPSRMAIRSGTAADAKTLETGLPWEVLAYSPDGRYIALGNGAGTLQFRESLSGKLVTEQTVDKSPVTSLSFAPDNSGLILITTLGGKCLVRDAFTAKQLWQASLWPVRLTAAAWHPDNGEVVCAGYQPPVPGKTGGTGSAPLPHTLVLFDAAGRKKAGFPLSLSQREAGPKSIHFSTTGDAILVPTFDELDIFDPNLQRTGGQTFGGTKMEIRSTCLSRESGLLCVALSGGQVFSCMPRANAGEPRELFNLQSKISGLAEIGPDSFMAIPAPRDLKAMFDSLGAGGGMRFQDIAGADILNEPRFFSFDGQLARGGVRRVIGSRDIQAAAGSAFAGLYTIADSAGHLYTFSSADLPEEDDVVPAPVGDGEAMTGAGISIPVAMTAPFGASGEGVWFSRFHVGSTEAAVYNSAVSGGRALKDDEVMAEMEFLQPGGGSSRVPINLGDFSEAHFIGPSKQILVQEVRGEARRLQMVSLSDGRVAAEWDFPWQVRHPFTAEFSPDGNRLVLSLETGQVAIYQVGDGTVDKPVLLELKDGWRFLPGNDADSLFGLDREGHLLRWNLSDPAKAAAKSAKCFRTFVLDPTGRGLWGVPKDDPSCCIRMGTERLEEISSLPIGIEAEMIGVEATGQFLIASNSHLGRTVVDLVAGKPLFQVPAVGFKLDDGFGVVHGRYLYLSQLANRSLRVDFVRLRKMRDAMAMPGRSDLVATGQALLTASLGTATQQTALGESWLEAQRDSVAERIRTKVAAEKSRIKAAAGDAPASAWLQGPDIYAWPHFTWKLEPKVPRSAPKSIGDLEVALDGMWPGPIAGPSGPAGADFEALEKATSGKHPIVLAVKASRVLNPWIYGPPPPQGLPPDLVEARVLAEQALELLVENPSPFLPATQDAINRQLAQIGNLFTEPDSIVEYVQQIKNWGQTDFDLLFSAAGEYNLQGRFSRARGVVELVRAKIGEVRTTFAQPGAFAERLAQFEEMQKLIGMTENAAKTAPYLPVAMISMIAPATPASASGLRVGDLVYSVNGHALQIPEELQRVDQGRKSKLKVWRAGELIEIEAQLQGALPIFVMNRYKRALLVSMVTDGSPAAQTGLKRFDVLVGHENQAFDSFAALVHELTIRKSPIPITLFSPDLGEFKTQQSGDAISWRGETKTLNLAGLETSIQVYPWYFSEPLLRDKELPAKLEK